MIELQQWWPDGTMREGGLYLMEDMFAVHESRPTAVEIVVGKIKDLLIERRLKPGEMIPSEQVLAESLRVGRGSVREAIKILCAYGILEIKRGAGTYVSSASNKRLFDASLFQILVQEHDYPSLVTVRELLEEGIVNLVVEHATDAELALLNETMGRFLHELGKGDATNAAASRYDIQYHRLLGHCTHNSIVENIYTFVIGLFAPTINPIHEGVYEVHRALHEAIMRRDMAAAVKQVHRHTLIWKAGHESQVADTAKLEHEAVFSPLHDK
jgi:GntR family transcriptional repressor for pyruvate dehydrogenase complex